MSLETPGPTTFLSEMRRRHVLRIAIVYAVVGWIVVQVANNLFPPLQLPAWSVTLVVALTILGFPLALVVAWAFEITPEGIRRTVPAGETDADSAVPGENTRSPQVATTAQTGESRGIRSIAVLPFVDMSPQADQEYFSDGITEEILNVLSRVGRLRVPARTSSFAFKGKDIDVREIGERLNVESVLEGSVRKAGNRLRITAQLISVADGYHLWSERYDRELEDVFAIQDEIAHQIVNTLEVTLSDRELRAIKANATVDVRAYEYYLRGRQHFHQMRPHAFEVADQMFRRAIEIDPGYALAYAGLADLQSFMHTWFDLEESTLEEADRASRRALELDPNLAEAHAARGHALTLRKLYDEAEREFETAIRLCPRLYEAFYFYARACLAQGKLEKAARLFEQASQVRPEDYQALAILTGVYQGLSRDDDVVSTAERTLLVIDRHLELNPDDARAVYFKAGSFALLGRAERAREWAERALAMDDSDPGVLYNVACVYANIGDVEAAIDCLERHVDRHMPMALTQDYILHDPDLAPLHGQPRFEKLLARLE